MRTQIKKEMNVIIFNGYNIKKVARALALSYGARRPQIKIVQIVDTIKLSEEGVGTI